MRLVLIRTHRIFDFRRREALGSFGPSIAAFLAAWHEGGRKSAYRLLKRAMPSRIPFIYLLLIAFIPLGANGGLLVSWWTTSELFPRDHRRELCPVLLPRRIVWRGIWLARVST